MKSKTKVFFAKSVDYVLNILTRDIKVAISEFGKSPSLKVLSPSLIID